ncbi:MAG: N-acetyltransferase family protein [Phycisphaerae bacterium]
MTIRPATEADLQAILDIYNDAVAKTVATFDTQPRTMADHRRWFAEHGRQHPILVAEEGGRVIGWASVSRYSGRCAYDGTAEASLYVEEAGRGRGVGRQLLGAIIAAGRQAGLHTIISRIAVGNDASVHLHEAFGFQTVGVMREVGFKFGRYVDVVVMQLIYR